MATVLVVDDEAADRALMRDILESRGHKVWEASDYDNATASFEKHRSEIDLLLLDVSLPTRNGCELARALLRKKPDVKVLFVSGDAGAKVIRFYGLGTTDLHFLRKPLRGTVLCARIQQVLQSDNPLSIDGLERRGAANE